MAVRVVLPVYNEAQSIGPLLTRFAQLRGDAVPVEILCIDDGSTDASVEIIRSFRAALPVEVIPNPSNLGLGATIERGLHLAASRSAPGDIIVTMDADNTHPPELIGQMLVAMDGQTDLVIASRYQGGASVTGLGMTRRLLTIGARYLFRLAVPISGVRDYTCGFRAYRAGLLQQVMRTTGGRLATETGFAAMAEILIQCGRAGARVREVPLALRYDLKGGASKMNVPRTVLRIAALCWRSRFAPPPLAQPEPQPDYPAKHAQRASGGQ